MNIVVKTRVLQTSHLFYYNLARTRDTKCLKWLTPLYIQTLRTPLTLICRHYGHDPNIAGQKSATRAFKNAHISSIVTGVLIFLYARYYYKHSVKDKGQSLGPTKAYQDPDFGKSGRMVYIDGYLLPEFCVKTLDDIHKFAVHEGDIFVCSFPKSGKSVNILTIWRTHKPGHKPTHVQQIPVLCAKLAIYSLDE